jgi:hypothetical protein
MSAFTSSQLPTGARACDTVEKLALWCAYVLRRFTVKKTFLRQAGLPEESICSVSRFTDADGNNKIQIVLIMPEIDNAEQTLADWMTADQIATTAIPSTFSG